MSNRQTRSNSTTSTVQPGSPKRLTLNNIKEIVSDANKEILQSIQSLKNDFFEIRRHLSALSSRINGLETSLTDLKERHGKYEDEVKDLKQAVEAMTAPDFGDVFRELEERQLRRDNVMIFGIPETAVRSLSERKRNDDEQVKSVLQEIGLSEIEPSEIRRVGKLSTNRPRPLKIKFNNQTSKYKVLQKAKGLKDSHQFKQVMIRNDLTRAQLQEQNALWDELKRLRDQGNDVVIYRGRIQQRSALRNFLKEF